MEKQSLVLDIGRDGTVKLPPELRRNLGNPEQLGVTRIGSSLVLAPIPERWTRSGGRVIYYENKLIVRHPRVMFGTPVIAGTRIPVRTIVGYVESGYAAEKICQEFPQLTIEQIDAATRFARKQTQRRTRRNR